MTNAREPRWIPASAASMPEPSRVEELTDSDEADGNGGNIGGQ